MAISASSPSWDERPCSWHSSTLQLTAFKATVQTRSIRFKLLPSLGTMSMRTDTARRHHKQLQTL